MGSSVLSAELTDTVGSLQLDVQLDVAPGRCLALAGPSGAGKSTILRLLAGTRRPRDGRIRNGADLWLDSASGACLAPELRRCGYLFQEYALFPHLSAWRNVAYGMRTTPRRERREAAIGSLARMGIAARAEAKPAVLSGGERQRVALARALAADPSVLLLDEPLSALDPRSRASATRELAGVLRLLQVPAILVTHDFAEAATLGDEVGVIDGGRIVQRGTPSELASAPVSAFVADFTGAIVLTGTAMVGDGELTIVELDGGGLASTTGRGSGRVALGIYPWEINITLAPARNDESARNRLPARILSVTRLGNRVRLGLDAGQPLVAEITGEALSELGLEPGREVTATWKATATRLVAL
jgi:molybdate transport system ATP-binding protein